VFLNVAPTVIDTGDIMKVTVDIQSVDPLGAALKVRFPVGLLYVPESSILEAGGMKFEIAPQKNVSDSDNVYLIFYITNLSFGGNPAGQLSFKLLGDDEVSEGEVGVDTDLDDPRVENAEEFDVEDPDFTAQDSVSVRVNN